MKPLTVLNNVEKAKLLHELFPAEIPALLDFTQGVCETIKEREQQSRKEWDNGLFSFDFWLSLIEQADKTITKYGKQLHKSSSLFADQLFNDYNAMFMVHCLTIYTTKREHPNKKFTLAVDLIFNP